MPVVSRFYGIAVKMYFNDHAPPHFHATYGGEEAVVAIESRAVLRGSLPGRAERMVEEWALLHREELLENWSRARLSQPLQPIAPLD